MTFIASLFALAALWALVTGRAQWGRRKVLRSEEPLPYWISVALCVGLALLLLSAGPVR